MPWNPHGYWAFGHTAGGKSGVAPGRCLGLWLIRGSRCVPTGQIARLRRVGATAFCCRGQEAAQWVLLNGFMRSVTGCTGTMFRYSPCLEKACYAYSSGWCCPPSVVLGRNVLIGYQGLGTVIHAEAVIGDRVRIGTNVTLGGRSGRRGVPTIEDDVDIGAGARLLGPIRIGVGARIGANAVVPTDVPPRSVFAGVPVRAVHGAIDGQTDRSASFTADG